MNRRILALAASISILGCVTASGDGESDPTAQEPEADGGAFAPAADPIDDSGSSGADTSAPEPSDDPSEEPAEPADAGGVDGATSAPDSSAPTTSKDSGTASKDTGTASKDTGTASPKDSGTAPKDSGTAPTDTGTAAPKDSGSAADTSVADTATGGTVTPKYVKHELTFYGWPDNDPPGGNIAYPKIHSKAGGTGTYADPITFATATAEFAPGTILYVPMLQKYVIMEDLCAACTSDWSSGKRHIDIWMNSNGTNNTKLLACQYSWTRPSVDVEISPPNNRPVSTVPLFEPATGVCQSPPA